MTVPALPWWEPETAGAMSPLLCHRRWWWHQRPFPHVRAVNVFTPAVYAELEDAFLGWLSSSGGGATLAAHDLRGTTVTSAFEGPLRLFASRGWQALLARALGVRVTQHVNLGLHHHEPGGLPGFAHNDLNPGWFPEVDAPSERVVLADPGVVDYTSGRPLSPEARPVRVVRAVAVLFYLANPAWERTHRGETGLYTRGGRDMSDPVASAAPHNNSLLVFECTPWSFHGFRGGGSVGRNSVVAWLHRPEADVVNRWGPDAVMGYGTGA
ncbi:MAG TPA: hypothetical protein VFQ11_02545 [Nocardioidaceae bacterium]|nr:hypothetical protein [Nocardioidaceae bacterium]